MEFVEFKEGDVGFHFGTKEQAENRAKNKNFTTGRTFRVLLNIENPVQVKRDIMNWHANAVALRLWSEGVISQEEEAEIQSLWSQEKSGQKDPAAVRLREILAEKGYDGIRYPNDFEGAGDSFIAFRDDQIIKTEISPFARENSSGSEPKESVGAAPQGFTGEVTNRYYDLLTDKNAQKDRATDVRPMEVPKKDTLGRIVSEFAANMYGSEVMPDSFVDTVRDLVVSGALGHDRKKQSVTMQEAADWIKRVGKAAATRQITAAAMDGKYTDTQIAAAMLLAADSMNTGKEQEAAELVVDLSTMATDAGRKLALYNVWRKLTPQGKAQTVKIRVQRYVDTLNKTRGKNNQVSVEVPQNLWDDFIKALEAEQTGKNAAGAETSESTGQDSANPDEGEQMPTTSSSEEAEETIYKYVAAQIPGTFWEKWDAWRRMMMLGNFKTQERNFGGSLAFRPFVAAKRGVSAALQSALRVPKEERTAAIVGLGKEGNALMKLARQDAKTEAAKLTMERSEMSGKDKPDISQHRKIFENKTLEDARTMLADFMEGTDALFKRWEYSEALASFVKARGYTAQQWQDGQIPAEVMQQARSYAGQSALKATFNDVNAFSEALSNIGRSIKRKAADSKFWRAIDVAFQGNLPFTSTPANVAVRIAEYSPANLIRASVNFALEVSDGEMSAAEAIDRMASGLVGTGAMALGVLLGSGLLGIKLRGTEEDEDEERTGVQSYALEIGGRSYSIDWMAPSVVPLLVGANIAQAFEDPAEASAFAKVLSATVNAFEPMLEMSMLSGLNDLAESAKYSEDGEMLYAMAATTATSYLTQALPSVFSQVDQLGGGTRKKLYSSADNALDRSIEKFVGKLTQRIPGVDLYQTEYVDAWGRTDKTNAVEALLSPTYVNKIQETDIDKEIIRLNEAQDENASPKTPGYTVTVDGNEIRLTGEQWSKLAKEKGQLAFKIASDVIKLEGYQLLNDTQKAKLLQSVYSYAQEQARAAVLDGYEAEKAEGNPAEVLLQKAIENSTGLSKTRYEKAQEKGIRLDLMREVSGQVKEKLKEVKNPSDYDTYRALIESDPEDLRTWLEIYGMSDTRLEVLEKAQQDGITPGAYVDYLEANSKLDSSMSDITTAWKKGKEPDVDAMMEAFEAYNDLPDKIKEHFAGELSGRMRALTGAMDNQMDPDTFVELWGEYYRLNQSDSKQKSAEWAAILDKSGITQKQKQIMQDGFYFSVTLRQDAAKYEEMKGLGMDSDAAKLAQSLTAGLDSTTKRIGAISKSKELSAAEKQQAMRAYLTDDQERKLDQILRRGYSVDNYASLYKLYTGTTGDGKKARTVAEYVKRFGITEAEARTVYDIFAKAAE